jgi:hypothetical protein
MTTLVGAIGASLLLLPFLANLAGLMSRHNIVYQVLNAAGAAILVWYGVVTEGYVFVFLESVWALAALLAIYQRIRREPSADERE